MKPRNFKFLVAAVLAIIALTEPSATIAATGQKKQVNALRFSKQTVSANLNRFPLKTILLELNQRGVTNIVIPENMRDTYITVTFKDLPILEALKKILQDSNYVIEKHRDQPADSDTPAKIFLLPDNNMPASISNASAASTANQKLQIESDETEQKTPLTPEDLVAKAPEDRIKSLNTMVSTYGDEALPFIISALSDASANVRLNALRLIGEQGHGEVPTDTLERLALSDENKEIRSYALQLIAEDPENSESVDEIMFLRNSTD